MAIDKNLIFIVYAILIVFSIILTFYKVSNSIGQSFFTSLIAIGFTYFFTKHLFEYDKKKRWTLIKNKVTSELNGEFSSILTDISNICGFKRVGFFDINTSGEEISKEMDKMVLKQLEDIANNKNVKISEDYKTHLLDGNLGPLFSRREEYLDKFQIKYLEYLEGDVVMKLIDIQKAFRRIDQEIIIRIKQVENKWIRFRSDEQIVTIIENQFQIIIDGIQFMVNKGILNYK